MLGRLLPSSDKIKEKTEPKGVRNGLAHNGGTKLKPPRKFLFKGGLSELLSGKAVYPLQ